MLVFFVVGGVSRLCFGGEVLGVGRTEWDEVFLF